MKVPEPEGSCSTCTPPCVWGAGRPPHDAPAGQSSSHRPPPSVWTHITHHAMPCRTRWMLWRMCGSTTCPSICASPSTQTCAAGTGTPCVSRSAPAVSNFVCDSTNVAESGSKSCWQVSDMGHKVKCLICTAQAVFAFEDVYPTMKVASTCELSAALSCQPSQGGRNMCALGCCKRLACLARPIKQNKKHRKLVSIHEICPYAEPQLGTVHHAWQGQ